MSHSDLAGLTLFVALIISPIAYLYWRFGDPDRDDRISSRPTSVWGFLAILWSASAVRAAQDRDWIWFGLLAALTLATFVRWRRERRHLGRSRA